MAEFTLVSFNTHYGLLPLRDDCGPYDLIGALVALGDPDVLVVQEVWRPDGERGVVDDFADEHGYKRHDLELSPSHDHADVWPHAAADGEGTFGLAVLSRLPAAGRRHSPWSARRRADPDPERRMLHLEVDVDGMPSTSSPST